MGRFHKGFVFGVYLLINLLSHLPFLSYPPSGSHVWRQCNTMAMSRNFSEESMHILEPRIDRRNNSDGITGAHFPLYEWLLAALFKVFGFSETLARLWSTLLSSAAMAAVYLILLKTGSSRAMSFAGGLLLLSVPQIYYDGINAMPDILALPAALFSLYFFLEFFSGRPLFLGIAGLLLAMLCGLVKFQFLIIPFSALAYMRMERRNLLFVLPAALLTLLTVSLWYRYALQLTEQNNLREFGLWIKPISGIEKLRTLYWNLISDLPELLTGWPLLLALLLLMAAQRRRSGLGRFGRMAVIWLSSFAMFYLLAIERMQHHSYYFMALIPLLVLTAVRLADMRKTPLGWVWVLLLLNFGWSFARIIPSRWTPERMGIPTEFADPVQRKAIERLIPEHALCLSGPDLSGCIYLYFAHAKGYSFADTDELFETEADGKSKLQKMCDEGLTHILIRQDQPDGLHPDSFAGFRKSASIGAFEIWEYNPASR